MPKRGAGTILILREIFPFEGGNVFVKDGVGFHGFQSEAVCSLLKGYVFIVLCIRQFVFVVSKSETKPQ